MADWKKQFGRYELIEKVGQGAFATVYRAMDTALNRVVALKVMHPQLMTDRDLIQRFSREARVIAALNHPNIVSIYDVGEEEGYVFLVMQYLPGITLGEWLRQGTPTLEQGVKILEQVAFALDYAHKQGIVHRDIKPSNIILEGVDTPDRIQAVLTDFGLANAMQQASTAITATGATLGTPQYMSPEQIDTGRFGAIGQAADQYSLGVIAYELLTGQLPFAGESPMAIVYSHVSQTAPVPSVIRPALPAGCDPVLLKVLAKSPTDRYPTATAFVEALEHAVAGVDFAEYTTIGMPGASRSGTSSPAAPSFPQPKPVPASPNIFSAVLAYIQTSWSRIGKRLSRSTTPPKPETSKEVDVKFETRPAEVVKRDAPPKVPPSIIAQQMPSLILNPKLANFLNPIKENTIRDLLSRQEPERLIDYIVEHGGRRFIITGYGSFGGTTLTKEIIRAVKRELEDRPGDDHLLAVRFRVDRVRNNEAQFTAVFQEQDRHSLMQTLDAASGNHANQAQVLLDEINAFFLGQSSRSEWRKIIEASYDSKTPPTRLVIAIDKISDPNTLDIFTNHPLFEQKVVTYLVVVPRENYDQWPQPAHNRLKRRKRFEVWPVPCLWETEYQLVDQTMSLFVSGYGLGSREAKAMHHAFIHHITYIGRGAIGTMLNELQQLRYWRFDDYTKQPFIAFDSLDKELIIHNASIQTMLDANWNRILGRNFPGRERTDRAKQGVYALMDWIIDYATFTMEDVLHAATKTVVMISPNERLRNEVVFRLLDVLVENAYLQRMQDEFDIIWGRDVTNDSVKLSQNAAHAEDIKLLKELLQQHYNNLNTLKVRHAKFGALGSPLWLDNQIDEERKRIEEIEAQLASLTEEDSNNQ